MDQFGCPEGGSVWAPVDIELARSGRAASEPLRLTLDGVVIDVPDGFNDQTLARVLAVVRAC